MELYELDGSFLKWGTPKSSILICFNMSKGFSIINQLFWVCPFMIICGNLHIIQPDLRRKLGATWIRYGAQKRNHRLRWDRPVLGGIENIGTLYPSALLHHELSSQQIALAVVTSIASSRQCYQSMSSLLLIEEEAMCLKTCPVGRLLAGPGRKVLSITS